MFQKELVEWSKATWSPDEMVWATAVRQKGAPGQNRYADYRLILWGRSLFQNLKLKIDVFNFGFKIVPLS